MIKPHSWSSPARLKKFTSGVIILFLISSLIFSGLSSTNFVGVSAQTDNNSLQSRTDDRANQNVGVVTINENGTVTFFPGLDYAGTVRFPYTISDGEGNSDKAKVSVIIKAPSDRTSDQSGQGQGQGQDQDVQGNQHEREVKTANKNQVDNKASSELIQQEFHRSGGTNDTDNNIR